MLGFYLVDNEDFTELFCINKEKPELECNGKCEVSKIAQQEQDQKEKSTVLDLLQYESVYNKTQENEIVFNLINIESKSIFVYINHYLFQSSDKINHPPILV